MFKKIAALRTPVKNNVKSTSISQKYIPHESLIVLLQKQAKYPYPTRDDYIILNI